MGKENSRGILDILNQMTSVLGMREWTAKRILESESQEGPVHGGLSGFNLPVARRSPQFMEKQYKTISYNPCIHQFIYSLCNETRHETQPESNTHNIEL